MKKHLFAVGVVSLLPACGRAIEAVPADDVSRPATAESEMPTIVVSASRGDSMVWVDLSSDAPAVVVVN